MTPQERQLLEEAEEAAVQSAQEFADAQMTSGIRPPPTIDETETSLEPQLFGFEFGQQPAAESEPVSSAPVPIAVTCPPANPCTLDLSFTSAVYTVSQTGLSINPDVCDTYGWNGKWKENCANDACGHVTKFCTSESSCVCGVRLEWIEDVGASDPARVRIILDKIVGDGTLADGWYLWAVANWADTDGDPDCFWETAVCSVFPCTCVYLGDLTVFDTDFSVSIPMPVDPVFNVGCGGDATLDLNFHPC